MSSERSTNYETNNEIDPLLRESQNYHHNNTLSIDIVNHTLTCLNNHMNLTSELSEKGGFCNTSWDSVLCWPPTPLNTTAVQNCFSEYNGVRYDDTRKYLFILL